MSSWQRRSIWREERTPQAVAVQQHTQQQLGVVGGVAVPVVAVRSVEGVEVELVDHVEDEPGEVVVGEPVAQVGWEQEGLVAVTAQEVVSHKLFYYFALFALNAPEPYHAGAVLVQEGFGMANAGSAPLIPPQLAALFADGGLGRTLSVALPAGHLVGTAAHPGRRTRVRPAFWLSDEPPTATLWTRLRAEHERSGLWPLLLEDFGNFDADDDDELAFPWGGEASAEPVGTIDGHDAAGFLAATWAAMAEVNDEMFQEYPEFLLPFGRDWPGLATRGELTDDPGAVADRCAQQAPDGDLRLGLVPVRRGADALVATGWRGAVNYFDQVAPLAAVVRSWEDRFGARVVGLGGATALLSVAAPPVTFEHALQVAAEHLMCCSDNVTGVGTLAEHAEGICGETTWSFWWD
jgi:hypothetical protein